MRFNELGLSAELLRAVSEQGYTDPTAVQREAIPAVLAGADLMAGAQTGTGKTAAFVLPLLQKLNQHGASRGPRAIRTLIMTPTRELAQQVRESVRVYGRYLPLKSAVVHGGVSINPQISALRNGVDMLVATPGRLLDHVRQRTVDLSKVEILVLDEADRMLDMGFIHDIRKILQLLPAARQNLLFSATFSNDIRTLANEMLDSPKSIQVARRSSPAELVEQKIHPVDQSNKRALLAYLIGSKNWRQVLVFTRTKHGADRLTRQLGQDGLKAIAIHGNKSQSARTRALADFKQSRTRVLVATDIAARGLDIDQLPHVVNYELPNVPEDYVHRIGRTGRAGNEGEATSLVSGDEQKHLQGIERLLNRTLPSEVVPGYEPDPNAAPAPQPKLKKTAGRRLDSANHKRDKNSGSPRHGKRPRAGQRGKAISG